MLKLDRNKIRKARAGEKWEGLQPMIPPKRFDIFPPDWGMPRRSRRVLIFLKKIVRREPGRNGKILSGDRQVDNVAVGAHRLYYK